MSVPVAFPRSTITIQEWRDIEAIIPSMGSDTALGDGTSLIRMLHPKAGSRGLPKIHLGGNLWAEIEE